MHKQALSYKVVRRPRKRNITITVSLDGCVTVSGPKWTSDRDFERAVASKEQWIRNKLQAFEAKRRLIPRHTFDRGDQLPLLGQPLTVEHQHMPRQRSIRVEKSGARLMIQLPAGINLADAHDSVANAVEAFYIREGKQYFPGRVNHYAALMRVHPTRVTVKRQKRRWGSCNAATGSLNFNWKLMMAPLWVLDYVVVHELAHLMEANHSRAFWAIVDRAYPRWREAQDWLKKNGMALTVHVDD